MELIVHGKDNSGDDTPETSEDIFLCFSSHGQTEPSGPQRTSSSWSGSVNILGLIKEEMTKLAVHVKFYLCEVDAQV